MRIKFVTNNIIILLLLITWPVYGQDANDFLQQGHKFKKNGDLEKAIESYKKSLEISPGFSSAKFSLESALALLKLEHWSFKLSEKCQTTNNKIMLGCANKYFSFNGKPIHPKIIKELNTWISDGGDQVVSINIIDSQDSNRFCCVDDIKLKNEFVYYQDDETTFNYKYIGVMDSGVHVLYTSDSPFGASGVFRSLVFVTFKLDSGLMIDSDTSLVSKETRLLISKVGEMSLGDRWEGHVSIMSNDLYISDGRKIVFPIITDSIVSEHPIDSRLKRCVDKESTTSQHKLCISKAYEEWDKELNRAYKLLTAKLNANTKKVIRDSQRQWIKYRDAQINAINEIYDGEWSTAGLSRMLGIMDLTKNKSLELLEFSNNREQEKY